ncbi:hypothetical protein CYLTODRAFT_368694 [Cylindrobasidium torrendii FP15055 ss-10]|uniref:Nucleoside transporter n=1 Tax=Cylindrobasidium torrendii FP15055 ss-10 TaxID=1314674 RepID=A0A0D7BMY1_9AGAR|nr:hypothetical protein CYLTODRAFT_368694 [Cylindrobasidium torrendii FP15055 ss-10]
MPIRTRSPEAHYHAIPQGPVAVNPLVGSLEPESDGELEDDVDVEHAGGHLHSSPSMDAKFSWVFVVFGCAVLLPWNVMITATPYFLARLSNSPLKPTFSSYMSTSFTAANVVFLAHATATSKQTSPSRQVVSTLIGLSFLTFLLTVSTFVHATTGLFFAFVLMTGIAQAGLGSYLQTSCIAIASLFGPAAMQALMSGQAAIAVVVSGVQVVSAIASTWNEESTASGIPTGGHQGPEERSAFVFFLLSTIFLLGAVGGMFWLVSTPEYKTVAGGLERGKYVDDAASDASEASGLVASRSTLAATSLRRMITRNALFHIAVAYVFLVTLAVFPPITTSIAPVNPNVHPLLFTSIHFFVFGVGDLAGRSICSYRQFQVWDAKRLLVLSLARTLFIPLFLLCNVQRPSATDSAYTPIINSDWAFMFILFVFALTNGQVSSMCMMAAPSLEHNPRLKGNKEDIDVAATVASFCLVVGLALGSLSSFAVRWLVCDCNPLKS